MSLYVPPRREVTPPRGVFKCDTSEALEAELLHYPDRILSIVYERFVVMVQFTNLLLMIAIRDGLEPVLFCFVLCGS